MTGQPKSILGDPICPACEMPVVDDWYTTPHGEMWHGECWDDSLMDDLVPPLPPIQTVYLPGDAPAVSGG